MNFTSDVKREIIANGIEKEGAKSALSALVRTSGNVGLRGGVPTFYFVSETENVAEFFMSAFEEKFAVAPFVSHASRDKMSGRAKLVIECPEGEAERVAKELGLAKRTGDLHESIPPRLISTQEGAIAYIQGAFLGGGSCTVPFESGKNGYHLEFVFQTKKIAQQFCRILEELELVGKLAARKESYVVYIKSKELISDFLSVIGAGNCLKKFSALVEKRDKANNDNRAFNCMVGNVGKTAEAAVHQTMAIQRLLSWSGFSALSEDLRKTALARMENPTLSLQELANTLCVSKSCLNHRMRKLLRIESEIKTKE